MAKVKLNVNRTQWIDVPVPVGNGKFETFQCEMRIIKNDEKEAKILDLLVSVKDLELEDEKTGRLLSHDEMLEAIKNDNQLSVLVTNAWTLGNANIVKKQGTLLQPQNG